MFHDVFQQAARSFDDSNGTPVIVPARQQELVDPSCSEMLHAEFQGVMTEPATPESRDPGRTSYPMCPPDLSNFAVSP